MNTSTPSKGVSLPQYGGEMKETYKGNKSDMGLGQHGGEGGALSKKSDFKLWSPTRDYCGPGRYI